MATLKNTTINDSETLTLPASAGSTRPASPVSGQIRLNTGTNEVETYKQNKWEAENNQNKGVVLDSLVLHVDASDPQSYPGAGTSWFDLSGNGNNATFNGATYNVDATAGSCFQITANGNSIDVPYSSSLDFGSKNELTIEAWVYLTSDRAGTWIVKRDDWDYGLALNTTGRWRAHRNIGGSIYYPDYQINNFPVNRWYHIVQVFNTLDNTKLYINGQLQAEFINNFTSNRPLGNGVIQLIRNTTTNTSKIAQVRMYDRLLSQREVIRNFKATQTKFGVPTQGSGLSPGDPAPSAAYIREVFGYEETGYYWISSRTFDPVTRPARPVFCDMQTNGGGWMLMMTLHGGPQGSTGALNHFSIQNADPVSYDGFVPRRYGGPTQSKGVSHAYTMFRNSQNFNIMKTYSFWNSAGTPLYYLNGNSAIRIPFDTCETGRAVSWNNIFGTAFPTGVSGTSEVTRTLNNLITVRADDGFIGAAVLAGSTESIINFANIGIGFPSDADPVGTTRFPSNRFGAYGNARHWLVYSNSNGTNSIRCQPTCWGSENVYQENSWWIKDQLD